MTILGLLFIAAVGFAFAMALVRPWFCFVLVCCFPIIEGVIQSYIPFFASEGNRPLINYMVALLAATTVVVLVFFWAIREGTATRCAGGARDFVGGATDVDDAVVLVFRTIRG